MKVLFLDVDGVLNTHGTAGTIDEAMAERVRRILRETGAYLVISSSWRRNPVLVSFLLQQLGKDAEVRWLGSTPNLVADETTGGVALNANRGEEIETWLRTNSKRGVRRFVILDDRNDMDNVRHNLVRTDADEGLTDNQADEAIQLLNA